MHADGFSDKVKIRPAKILPNPTPACGRGLRAPGGRSSAEHEPTLLQGVTPGDRTCIRPINLSGNPF